MSAASTSSEGQLGGSGRSCRYQAHIIGTASFMISEGWKRNSSEIEPALRALADVADGRDHQQQEHPEPRTATARAPQEIRVDLREQQHGHGADAEASSGAV